MVQADSASSSLSELFQGAVRIPYAILVPADGDAISIAQSLQSMDLADLSDKLGSALQASGLNVANINVVGLDERAVIDGNGPSADEPSVHPHVARLQKQIDEQQQQVDALRGDLESEKTKRQRQDAMLAALKRAGASDGAVPTGPASSNSEALNCLTGDCDILKSAAPASASNVTAGETPPTSSTTSSAEQAHNDVLDAKRNTAAANASVTTAKTALAKAIASNVSVSDVEELRHQVADAEDIAREVATNESKAVNDASKSCEHGIASMDVLANSSQVKVFTVSGSACSRDLTLGEAEQYCSSHGGHLCSHGELVTAFQCGYETSTCGWVNSRAEPYGQLVESVFQSASSSDGKEGINICNSEVATNTVEWGAHCCAYTHLPHF